MVRKRGVGLVKNTDPQILIRNAKVWSLILNDSTIHFTPYF